jgi:hypothetical protein
MYEAARIRHLAAQCGKAGLDEVGEWRGLRARQHTGNEAGQRTRARGRCTGHEDTISQRRPYPRSILLTSSLPGVLSVLSPGAAGAAEITVLAGMGVASGVRDVAPAFERATGHKVIVSFEAGPLLMQKVNAGAPADLVTHYPEVIDDLIKQSKVVGSRVDFARAGVGVAVKAGAPKPDIDSIGRPSHAGNLAR